MRRPMRTWVYLFGINALVVCGGFLLLIAVSLSVLEHAIELQTLRNLRTFSHSVRELITARPPRAAAGENLDSCIKLLASHDPYFRITLIAADGTVLGESDTNRLNLENHFTRPEVKAALRGQEGYDFRRSSIDGRMVVYYAVPLTLSDSRAALRLSMPLASNVLFSTNLRQQSVIAAILILCVILTLSFAAAQRISKPLAELRNAAFRYRTGEFTYRPKIESPYEFAELAADLNRMALTIQDNIEDISYRRDYFESVFAHTAEALIVFTRGLQILEVNRAACRLFDTGARKADRSLISLVRSTEIIDFVQAHIADPAEEHGAELEITIQGADGAEHHLLARCSAITPENERRHFLLMLTDVTRLTQLEQIRKDFVANVSHELKTPVTSIKGFIETLLDGALSDEETARRFLTITDEQTARLSNIIDDLLSLSQLEQRGAAIRTQRVSVRAVFAQIMRLCLPEAQAKQTELSLSFLSARGAPLDGDIELYLNEGLFIQAAANIIGNAVKYCPSGARVDIGVQQTPPHGIMLRVEDNGPGIPAEYRTRIFERFFRVDKGRSRETGGTGLGLSIVRHIAELHGGSVQALARRDGSAGACFELYIPGNRMEPDAR